MPVDGLELRRDRRGGGVFVEVLSKTDFSFDGRGPGTDQIIPLAVGIDTFGWKSGVLMVCVHAIGTFSGTAAAIIEPINVSIVPEEPSVIFSTNTVLTGPAGPADIRIAPGILPGSLLTSRFGADVGPQLMLRLKWLQGATPAVAAQTFSMSCDLVGRYR